MAGNYARIGVALFGAAIALGTTAAADDTGRRYELWGTNAELRGEARLDYDHRPPGWYGNGLDQIFGPPRRRALAVNLHTRGGDATRIVRLQDDGQFIGEDHATQPNHIFFSRLGVIHGAWRRGANSDIFYDRDGRATLQRQTFEDKRAHDTIHGDPPVDVGSDAFAELTNSAPGCAAGAYLLVDAQTSACRPTRRSPRLPLEPLDFGRFAGGVGAR